MERLKRKADDYLLAWKANESRKPLIVKGARQIGKTDAIRHFAKNNYDSVVEINFILQKQYKDIFDDGFEVDTILRNISLKNPALEFIPGKTLLFFDELQDCVNCATSLKSFCGDGRYDVICSGSLMGINYREIESNSVGNKEDYPLFFYRNDRGTLEMDFFVRDADTLIPVEVKANDTATVSLNNLIKSDSYPDIHYGIKLANRNIGFGGKFFTFPYFLTFLLKRFLREVNLSELIATQEQ